MIKIMNALRTSLILTVLLLTTSVFGFSSSMMKIGSFDDLGTMIGNVSIHVEYAESKTVRINRTDEYGHLLLPDLPLGRYRVTASKNGFSAVESGWFYLTSDTIEHIDFFLAPETHPAGSRVLLKPIRFPALTFPMKWENGTNDLRTLAAEFPFIFLARNQNPVFIGTKTPDTMVYIDGIPLMDPLTRAPFMYPDVGLLRTAEINAGGSGAEYEADRGCTFDLTTKIPNDRLFSGFFGIRTVLYSDTQLTSQAASAAFRDWKDISGTDMQPPESGPEIDWLEYQLYLATRKNGFFGSIAGRSLESNAFFNSDYVNSKANSHSDIWGSFGYTTGKNLTFKTLFGFDDAWRRIKNWYRLRDYNPVFLHEKKYFAAFTSELKIENLIYRLSLSHQNGDLRSGPGADDNTFKSPEDFIRDDSSGLSQDIPLVRISNSKVTQLQLDALRNFTNHHIRMGGAVHYYDTNRQDLYFEQSSPPGAECAPTDAWLLDKTDYELGLWGRDRWFPSKNLEISFGVRWDRFHYLQDQDYLSLRVQGGYQFQSIRLIGGFERIISPPGLIYLYAHEADADSETSQASTLKPATGFLWFAGLNSPEDKALTSSLRFYYSLMSDSLELTYMEEHGKLRIVKALNGKTTKNLGVVFQAEYHPLEWMKMRLTYSWNRNRLQWPGDLSGSTVEPVLPERFGTAYDISGISLTNIPGDSSCDHRLAVHQEYLLEQLWKIRVDLDWFFSTGRPYSPETYEYSYQQAPHRENTNARHGPSWNRLDMGIQKKFRITNSIALATGIDVRNLLNSKQNPPVNPETGNADFDPYSPDYNQPMTISVYFTLLI